MIEGAIRIGEWLIEPARNCASRGSTEKKLDPRALDVLVHLAKVAPRTVSADELLDLFWKGRIVEASTVHRVISRIRSTLRDEPKNARYIQTVPKRGYRVVAQVERMSPTVQRPASPNLTTTEFLDLPRPSASLIEESDVLDLGRVKIARGSCTIGRADDNDLVLADGSISNRHARLSLGTAGWTIKDLGSTNGLYVNDAYVDKTTLRDGDLLQLGRVTLRFKLD